MATTIQVVENIQVGRFIDINGTRCEVEAISFNTAITNGNTNEELMRTMASLLIERDIIKVNSSGQYVFSENDQPLIQDDQIK